MAGPSTKAHQEDRQGDRQGPCQVGGTVMSIIAPQQEEFVGVNKLTGDMIFRTERTKIVRWLSQRK